MLTIQITNDHFHSRVLALLSDAQAGQNETSRLARPIIPSVPALTRLDTHLSPSEITSQLLAMTSPWIDMCSPDPIISGISKQVFLMEIAYAAFCGIEYIFVQGPRLSHEDVLTFGVPQYARAIQEALVVGSHMQVSIMLPMIDDPEDEHNEDIGSLARFTRDEYLDDAQEMKSKKKDYLGTWDAWNVIRSLCKYSPRLFVGKNIILYLDHPL